MQRRASAVAGSVGLKSVIPAIGQAMHSEIIGDGAHLPATHAVSGDFMAGVKLPVDGKNVKLPVLWALHFFRRLAVSQISPSATADFQEKTDGIADFVIPNKSHSLIMLRTATQQSAYCRSSNG
jgi:hypothetical protein